MKLDPAGVCETVQVMAEPATAGLNKTNPTINQPPPQPTTSTQKTGTPSTPSNTDRTTTSADAGGY